MAGERDGSRQRSFGHEGMRPSAGEHRERTTIRRREVGSRNGKKSPDGADRSSGRPPTASERTGDRCGKRITRIPSNGQIDRQTNRGLVSLSPVSLHSGPIDRQINRGPVSLQSRSCFLPCFPPKLIAAVCPLGMLICHKRYRFCDPRNRRQWSCHNIVFDRPWSWRKGRRPKLQYERCGNRLAPNVSTELE
jgi:hypothetical protein